MCSQAATAAREGESQLQVRLKGGQGWWAYVSECFLREWEKTEWSDGEVS